MQLIYTSRPFGYDDLVLTGILAAARRSNARDGITGALICREDLFLQMLEGPRDVVTATFARILRDDRHTEIVNLWSGPGCFRDGPCAMTRREAGCGRERPWPTAPSRGPRWSRSGASSIGWQSNRP
ncbi:MAG: BLUF domain-containing protein [Methyloceanibacter sp.]|uniref:BLUF domain-containing protein n=1 Tax=Methyloceanibacter sp. TaxID=1965321 RepID=UPI003D9AE332